MNLHPFRSNAVQVRQALDKLQLEESRQQVDGGYLRDAKLFERYKQLSIPVRRALNEMDSASFVQALTALRSRPGLDLAPIEAGWSNLQRELDSQVGLGGERISRRTILGAWLDATAFYDALDRDKPYDRLIDQWGKAAEGIGAQLMQESAQVVLLLDAAAASALGEPLILPPPPKTPPPPPDPTEPWWKRLLGLG